MIAEILQTKEFGKDGVANICPCETQTTGTVYAHSMESAVQWAKKLPLFEDGLFDYQPENNRWIITSKWVATPAFWVLIEGDHHPWERVRFYIYNRNTIYESNGYKA